MERLKRNKLEILGQAIKQQITGESTGERRGRRQRIGFIGITEGAGCSFLTTAAAGYFAARKYQPAVLELGEAGLFHSLGLKRHFVYRPYQPPYLETGQACRAEEVKNIYKGINWGVKTDEQSWEKAPCAEELSLIYNLQGDLTLCDFSGRSLEKEEGGETVRLLREMDHIFAVLDPLPSKLLKSSDRMAQLRLSQLPVSYIINKDNSGVDHRMLADFLGTNRYTAVPHLQPQWIYQAEYGCMLPYSIAQIAEQLEPVLDVMLGEIR